MRKHTRIVLASAMIENLEQRQMLSASMSFDNGLLSVVGDKGPNNITISVRQVRSGEIVSKLNVDGVKFSTRQFPWNGIQIDGRGGDDTIKVDVFTGNQFISDDYQFNILGGNGNDNITATSDVRMYVNTDNGNDRVTINDNGGDNPWHFVNGGAGKDVLTGYECNLYGGDDNDTLIGGDSNDLLDGGAGNDILRGGDNNDTLYGGAGNDLLLGGEGGDYLSDYCGADTLNGGEGNDTFWLTSQKGEDTEGDVILGGADWDVLYKGIYNPEPTTLKGIEWTQQNESGIDIGEKG